MGMGMGMGMGMAKLKAAEAGFRALGAACCPYSVVDASDGIGAEKGHDGAGLGVAWPWG